MRRQITASVRAGESVTRVAERLLDVGDPRVELPRHVQALSEAAKFPRHPKLSNVYEREVARWQGRIERLGQGAAREAGAFTVRSATQQLVKDLRRARPDQVDEVVNRWVLDRARHQARVVARSEAVEAYRDVYRKSQDEKPYVVGYRWVLSGSHPRPDICDVLASQDLEGLGPGGYKIGDVPATPHPSDLCSQVAIIDEQHFERELAAERGEDEPPRPWLSGRRESGEDWLRAQPEAFRRTLLGPSRAQALQNGIPVLSPDSRRVLPVHVVQGRPAPVRVGGRSVRARPLVREDRQRMAKPFPLLPPHGDPPPTPRRRRAKAKPPAKQHEAKAARAVKRAETEVDKHRVAIKEALEGISFERGAFVRRASRAFLARYGAAHADLPGSEIVSVLPARRMPRAYGSYTPSNGVVRLRKGVVQGAARAARRLAKRTYDPTAALTPRQAEDLNNLRTVLHEEFHGASARAPKGVWVSTAHGRLAEEMATEVAARRAVRDLAGYELDGPLERPGSLPRFDSKRGRWVYATSQKGGYAREVRDFVSAVHEATGWDPAQVLDRVESAALAVKRVGAKMTASPDEHLDALLDAIPGLRGARRTRLRERLLAMGMHWP